MDGCRSDIIDGDGGEATLAGGGVDLAFVTDARKVLALREVL